MTKFNLTQLVIIPIGINILTAILLYYILPEYIIICVVLLVMATMCYYMLLYFKEIKVFRKIGIDEILFEKSIPHIKDYEIDTNGDFAFWGISAKRFVNENSILNKFIEIGNKEKTIRFLLLNPDCPNLERKAIDEGEDPKIWREEIKMTISRLKDFAKKNNIEIKIRLFDTFPVWRIVMMNNSLMYVTYFIKNRQGILSPLLKLSDDCYDNLYRAFKIQFEDVWKYQSKETT